MSMEDFLALGTIDHLTEGWAILPFRGRVVHWWTKYETLQAEDGSVTLYRSACGINGATNQKSPALVPGNFPRCKRCEGRR